MMHRHVRLALGVVITLSMSSMAAAQTLPGLTIVRDPQVKRGFRDLSFGQPATASRPVVIWPERRYQAIETLGAPLPNVTAAPDPQSPTVPCTMRVVPVDPRQKSNMPVVSVDGKADPKGVVKIPTCRPPE
jgi:hypothetical protein